MRNRLAARRMENAGSRISGHQGFTLIELLVAISVLAFIAILGWRGIDAIVRARTALTADLEQTRGMQLAFAQLQSDCAHLAAPRVLLNRTPIAVGQGRLFLVRTVFEDNQPTRLKVVTYLLDEDRLLRHESPPTRDLVELDRSWRAAWSGIDTAESVTLQAGITGLTMRFWINKAWKNAANAAPPGGFTGAAQPTGLEVAMNWQGGESQMRKIFLLGAL